MSVSPWRCRQDGCGEELGVVEDGALYPKPYAPVRVDRDGTVWVSCPRCSQRRAWRPRPVYTGTDPTASAVGLMAGS